jgi:diacylglycerol kinase family enzyme
MSGIGVVLNPKSRRNLRDPRAEYRLARRLGNHGVVRAARSIGELYHIAEDFRRFDIDVLAISGGDGTNHVTLTGFLDVYGGAMIPRVALLRGGTMNTVANSVGIRGKPEGLLGRLIRDYSQRANEPLVDVERHVMKVSPCNDGAPKYGFLFGTGVMHGFLAEYYRSGDPSPLVAARTLALTVGSALVGGHAIRRMSEPFCGSVELEDGTRWPERDYLTVAAGTIAHVGLSFRPFNRFDERPGAFHALGVHSSAFDVVRELPRIHRAESMRPGHAYEAVSSRIVLRGAGRQVRYMIDGDLHEARGDLGVAIGPRVRLLVVR